jgi:hypothetical protein
MSGELFLLTNCALAVLGAALLAYWGFKRPYLAIPDDLEFRQVDFETLRPILQLEAFERVARLLEREGFASLGEFGTEFGASVKTQSYFRLYRHEEQGCFATVTQHCASGTDFRPYCRIVSLLEQEWHLSTWDVPPLFPTLAHLPRELGVHLPQAGPAELVANHLALRRRMEAKLGIQPLGDLTEAAYFGYVRGYVRAMREVARRRSLVANLWQTLKLRRQHHYQWLGDFAPRATGWEAGAA